MAQMRLERGWTGVVIHNLSTRGMMLWASRPPRAGAYVELRRATATIIARAVWVRDKFFGIKSEEPLNVSLLMSSTTRASAPASPALLTRRHAEHATRGSRRRVPTAPAIVGAFDFVMMTVIIALGAGLTAILSTRALETAAHLVRTGLLRGP